MKNIFTAVSFIVVLSCQAQEAKKKNNPGNRYSLYCNERFGYCIAYPSATLFPQPESENKDGRIFKNKQGEPVLTVYGSYPVQQENVADGLKAAFEKELQASDQDKNHVITYKKLGRQFYVVTGHQGNKIFYHKTIIKDDALAYALLQYDEKEKDYYQAVSERVFISFK